MGYQTIVDEYERCDIYHRFEPEKDAVQCELKASHAGDCRVVWDSQKWSCAKRGRRDHAPTLFSKSVAVIA